jgi:hypothetical protein
VDEAQEEGVQESSGAGPAGTQGQGQDLGADDVDTGGGRGQLIIADGAQEQAEAAGDDPPRQEEGQGGPGQAAR